MIGLYTAGVMLGLPKEDLIDTINSNTGRIINELLLGNRFVGNAPMKSIKDVLTYLRKNPFQTIEENLYDNIIQETTKLDNLLGNDNFIKYI
jgi:hypothetical protein